MVCVAQSAVSCIAMYHMCCFDVSLIQLTFLIWVVLTCLLYHP